MLLEGNTCNPEAFYRDFDVPQTPFTPETVAYVRRYV
jgi:NADH dehydrogenase